MIKKWKRTWIWTLSILLAITLSYIVYLFLSSPMILLQENPSVEILSSPNPYKFIKTIKNAQRDQVQIVGEIDTSSLGTHTFQYRLLKKTFTLYYTVVDTITPIVETKDAYVTIGERGDPNDFIASIQDATKTIVKFDKEYEFTTLGDVHIGILVEDEGKNSTKINATAHVVPKDTTPPIIHNVSDKTIRVGERINLLDTIYANDDRDGKLAVTLQEDNLDTQTPGFYKIRYEAIDKAGNKATKECNITVLPKATGNKILYLTINHGPSEHTPNILAILKTYHVKATFFVTGQNPMQIPYIKQVFQQGHAIGLQTYSNAYAHIYSSDTAFYQELSKIADVVKAQTGQEPKILRFPGGSSNTLSKNYSVGIMSRLTTSVQRKGYQYYDWNCAIGDSNPSLPSSILIETAKSCDIGGPIMMLTHDQSRSNATVEALPAIIEYYKKQEYTFETINPTVDGFHHFINN